MNFKSLADKREKFSIRKYKSIGAASAVVGILFLAGGRVQAAENVSSDANTETKDETVNLNSEADKSMNDESKPKVISEISVTETETKSAETTDTNNVTADKDQPSDKFKMTLRRSSDDVINENETVDEVNDKQESSASRASTKISDAATAEKTFDQVEAASVSAATDAKSVETTSLLTETTVKSVETANLPAETAETAETASNPVETISESNDTLEKDQLNNKFKMTLRRSSDNVVNENADTENKAETDSLAESKVESSAEGLARPTRSRRAKREVPADNRVLEAYVDDKTKKGYSSKWVTFC